MFVKNQVKIIPLVGLMLVYLFPFPIVDAEKIESGVTIRAPSTTQTEKICNDNIDNDNDGMVDENDQDCESAASQPMGLQCAIGEVDDVNGNGVIDMPGEVCVPSGTEDCSNGVDDNGDGLVDDADPTCGKASPQPMGLLCPAGAIDDVNGNGVIDMPGEVCVPSGTEICGNGIDDDGDGYVDEPECTQQADATAGTCGLKITRGVPIEYGPVTIGQESAEQLVEIKNDGTSPTPATIMMKGGGWIDNMDPDPAPGTISGPEATRVSEGPAPYEQKIPLSSDFQELGQLSGGQSTTINFQFKLDNAPNIDGSFHQDVTIDLLC